MLKYGMTIRLSAYLQTNLGAEFEAKTTQTSFKIIIGIYM